MKKRITWPEPGCRFKNKKGYWFTVIEVQDSLCIKIKFDEAGVEKIATKDNILKGAVHLPKYRLGQQFKDKVGNIVTLVALDKGQCTFEWSDGYTRTCQTSVISLNTIMREEDSQRLNPSIKIGDTFTLNCGSVAEVLEFINSKEVRIKIAEPVPYEDIVGAGNLKIGAVANKFKASHSGVGYLGFSCTPASSFEYKAWSSMIKRCYNASEAQATYADCSVDKKWFSLENFVEWAKDQRRQPKWQLDKDLLVKGNKVYSENFCVFLPREINTFLTNRRNHRGPWPVGVTYHSRLNKWQATCCTNSTLDAYLGVYTSPEEAFYVYKETKEKYAKQLAEKWQGVIEDKAVEALMLFTVDIND